MKITKFEDLEIWKRSLSITKNVYDISTKREFFRDFELKNQIRRAVISISSNIVEGFEKNNNNEFVRFMKIAKGSIGEVRNQLYISKAIGYISSEEFIKLNSSLIELGKKEKVKRKGFFKTH